MKPVLALLRLGDSAILARLAGTMAAGKSRQALMAAVSRGRRNIRSIFAGFELIAVKA
jgi:hypothetical protein